MGIASRIGWTIALIVYLIIFSILCRNAIQTWI